MDRLHLDLLAGARADMIGGALVAVGAPLEAAVEALAQVGLQHLDVVSEETARAGLRATRLRILLDGVDVDPGASHASRGARNVHVPLSKRGRHRHHTAKPRLDAPTRTAPRVAAIAAAATAADARGGSGAVVDERAILAAARGTGRRSCKAPALPEKWLGGGAAPASALVDVVRESDLAPVPKALALKALRRAVDALAHVAADGARTKLPGARAARLLADVVTGAAFVAALSPASVTSSPIGLGLFALDDDDELPIARAWLLEVLAGVPIVELEPVDDVSPSTVDVAGAAFAWAVVHRFGARGVALSTRQGLGACAVQAPGRAVVARALVGPPPFVATRAGSREASTAIVVEGTAPVDVDAPELSRALRALTGSDVELSAPGSRGVRVRALVSLGGAHEGAQPHVVDDVTTALWRAGCVDVVATWVERRRPGVQEVTVAIGRGRTKASVRVVLLSNGDEILRIDPDMDDVRAAAAKRGEPVHAIAAAAVALAMSARVNKASEK